MKHFQDDNEEYDSMEEYESGYEKVKEICEENGTTLIITTIPIIPLYTTKNAEINTFVENSGTRYIDSNSAVSAYADGNLYDECLFTDNVHPTAKAAMCLFASVLEVFPELLQ